jgi:hypothetical protein
MQEERDCDWEECVESEPNPMEAGCSKRDQEIRKAECGGEKQSDCDWQGLDSFAKRVAEEGCREKGNQGGDGCEQIGEREHLLGFSIGRRK